MRYARISVDPAMLWLANRPDLKVRTRELYDWLLGKYIVPPLGDVPLGKLTPSLIRSWHAEISRVGSPTPVRQSYSLLRAMLATAVADEVILRNPCVVKGAGVSRAAERPVATIPDVLTLAEAVPARYRAFILAATWSSARWGELVALTRDRLDLLHGTMRIDRRFVELRGCRLELDSPKSEAGVRTVNLPPHLIPELEHHLATYVPADCPSVFPNSKGEPIKRSSFRSVWLRVRAKAGLPMLRFHDLRHTGNTLAATTGASTRELMARMGHSTKRAALIYQHATKDRDAAIAVALSSLAVRSSGVHISHRDPVERAMKPAAPPVPLPLLGPHPVACRPGLARRCLRQLRGFERLACLVPALNDFLRDQPQHSGVAVAEPPVVEVSAFETGVRARSRGIFT